MTGRLMTGSKNRQDYGEQLQRSYFKASDALRQSRDVNPKFIKGIRALSGTSMCSVRINHPRTVLVFRELGQSLLDGLDKLLLADIPASK